MEEEEEDQETGVDIENQYYEAKGLTGND